MARLDRLLAQVRQASLRDALSRGFSRAGGSIEHLAELIANIDDGAVQKAFMWEFRQLTEVAPTRATEPRDVADYLAELRALIVDRKALEEAVASRIHAAAPDHDLKLADVMVMLALDELRIGREGPAAPLPAQSNVQALTGFSQKHISDVLWCLLKAELVQLLDHDLASSLDDALHTGGRALYELTDEGAALLGRFCAS